MGEFFYKWDWDLKSDPENIWNWVSDTNKFNKDVGLPPVRHHISGDNKRRKITLDIPFLNFSYEETPFEWIKPIRFGVLRKFSRGPISELLVNVEFIQRSPKGTKLVYSLIVRTRSFVGSLIVPIAVRILKKRFERVISMYDENQIKGEPKWKSLVVANNREKRNLRELYEGLVREGVDQNIVKKIVDFIYQADDITLMRLRPYVISEYLKLPKRNVIESFLVATKLGLMGMMWELICPSCRGPADSLPSLKDVKTKVHCPSCLIDFEVNFDKSIEVVFKLNPRIRRVNEKFFCIGGPAITPHIVAQELLKPGDQRTIQGSFSKKIYRVRTLKLKGAQFFKVEDNGSPEGIFIAQTQGWSEEEPILRPNSYITLINSTDEEQLFIVEEFGWDDKILTANELFAFQKFRDLFSNELLKYGEKVSIENIVVVFTDIKGSSKIYENIGDAKAFDLVMKHFEILRKNIGDQGGAIVKTIGDSVMAVFTNSLDAIKSMLKSQEEIRNIFVENPIMLKVGIHKGSCVAITLNDNLDYFGKNINFASRLPKFSSGYDIILSDELYSSDDVKDWIEKNSYECENFSGEISGEIFKLWKIKNS